MKQGWEIKKLGEVCEINPSKKEAHTKLGLDDKVSFLPMEDLGIKAYYITPSQERSLSEVLSSYTYFADGDVLLAKVSPCFENGKIGIANNLTNGVGFGSSEYLTFRLGKDVIKEFLYFYLQNKTFVKEATKNLTGTSGLRRVPKSFVESCRISVPPREEQERIVEELNCLSGVIEKKKQQLRELDALAQSIFYQMFGDPITNEKGWEIKKWKDMLTIVNGKNQKTVENPVGAYPIYGSGGIMGYADKYLCPKNTIVIGRKGNINKPIFVKEPFWNVDTAFGLIADNTHIAPSYLFFYCRIFDFEQLNKAVTIPSLTKSDLLELNTPCPPLALQLQFAERIEKIEQQKKLISQSIKEVEDLFNSRMLYYFD